MTKEREQFIMETIMRYIKLGMDMEQVIRTTNITQREAEEVLDTMIKLLKER